MVVPKAQREMARNMANDGGLLERAQGKWDVDDPKLRRYWKSAYRRTPLGDAVVTRLGNALLTSQSIRWDDHREALALAVRRPEDELADIAKRRISRRKVAPWTRLSAPAGVTTRPTAAGEMTIEMRSIDLERTREIEGSLSSGAYKDEFKDRGSYLRACGVGDKTHRRKVDVLRRFVEELGISEDVLEAVHITSLYLLVDVVDETNVAHWLARARETTPTELATELRRQRGLNDGVRQRRTYLVYEDQEPVLLAADQLLEARGVTNESEKLAHMASALVTNEALRVDDQPLGVKLSIVQDSFMRAYGVHVEVHPEKPLPHLQGRGSDLNVVTWRRGPPPPEAG